MQHLDNSITTFTKRNQLGIRRMTSKQGHGEPNPTWIPAGNEVTRRIAKKIDGVAGGTWGELFNIPLTAHFLGGAAIGDGPEHGVIDPYQRVYGYPTLSVMDGAAISANLGVNPSLSITAQAERAASLWPNKGQDDQRPRQGGRTGGWRRSHRSILSFPPMHPPRCGICRSNRSTLLAEARRAPMGRLAARWLRRGRKQRMAGPHGDLRRGACAELEFLPGMADRQFTAGTVAKRIGHIGMVDVHLQPKPPPAQAESQTDDAVG